MLGVQFGSIPAVILDPGSLPSWVVQTRGAPWAGPQQGRRDRVAAIRCAPATRFCRTRGPAVTPVDSAPSLSRSTRRPAHRSDSADARARAASEEFFDSLCFGAEGLLANSRSRSWTRRSRAEPPSTGSTWSPDALRCARVDRAGWAPEVLILHPSRPGGHDGTGGGTAGWIFFLSSEKERENLSPGACARASGLWVVAWGRW